MCLKYVLSLLSFKIIIRILYTVGCHAVVVELRCKWTQSMKNIFNGRIIHCSLLLRNAAHQDFVNLQLRCFQHASWFELLHCKAHYYTDKLKHSPLFKLLSNTKMKVTKSSWLLKQNRRMSQFSYGWPEHKTTQETNYIHKASVQKTFHLTKSMPCGPISSLYVLHKHYCAGMLLP